MPRLGCGVRLLWRVISGIWSDNFGGVAEKVRATGRESEHPRRLVALVPPSPFWCLMKIAKCIVNGRVKTWTVSLGDIEAETIEQALRLMHRHETDPGIKRTAATLANKLRKELLDEDLPIH